MIPPPFPVPCVTLPEGCQTSIWTLEFPFWMIPFLIPLPGGTYSHPNSCSSHSSQPNLGKSSAFKTHGNLTTFLHLCFYCDQSHYHPLKVANKWWALSTCYPARRHSCRSVHALSPTGWREFNFSPNHRSVGLERWAGEVGSFEIHLSSKQTLTFVGVLTILSQSLTHNKGLLSTSFSKQFTKI